MESYRFTELVEKENGFEFYQAFRDEVDWVIGGKVCRNEGPVCPGNIYWYDSGWCMERSQNNRKGKEEKRKGNARREHYKTHRGKSLFYAGRAVGQG